MLPSTTFAALDSPVSARRRLPDGPHRTRRARHSRSLASQTSPRAMNTATIAGAASTLMFAGSTLPMVVRAARTRDLSSYSQSHLFMTNAGNAVHTLYIASLPPGPVWLLHCMYSGVAVFMLAAHRRWARPQLDCGFASRVPRDEPPSTTRPARKARSRLPIAIRL